MSGTTATRLTNEQASVVFAPVDQAMVVTAPAGTGKTHTLVARAAHVIEHVDPRAGDVVVLSFSRAAAAEVRRRLRAEPSLPFIPVWTFDAFATELLSRLEPDGAWSSETYDGRIEYLNRLLVDAVTPDRLEGTVAHVLVDEAQDLEGVRAEFVLSLIKATTSSFTVFTDPTQAIYGFQRNGEPGPPLADGLAGVTGDSLPKQLSLTEQHRAMTDLVSRVMELGDELTRAAEPDPRLADRIQLLADSMPELPDLKSGRLLFRPSGRSTAVLCRSNAQALSASNQLRSLGHTHTLRRRSDERAVGRWLAAAAASTTSTNLERSVFEDAISSEPGLPHSPAEMWLALKRTDGRGAATVDLTRVAQMLLQNAIPDELNAPDDPHLVVSTIHRAKGLEFDSVVLVPGRDDASEAEADEEARIIYVALSRARENIFLLRSLQTHGLRWGQTIHRTIRAKYHGGWPQPVGVEMLGADTDTTLPAGASKGSDEVLRIQCYLREQALSGQAVELHRLVERRVDAESPTYAVVHDGLPIGRTSQSFGEALMRVRSSLPSHRFPERIDGARIQMVDTVAGDAGVGRSLGVSRCGLWSRVRLEGVGDFVYEESRTT